MARQERAVFTNMCMVYDKDKILVQNRRDPGWPGIVFPGGHVEPGESFVDSVIREVYEETGLTISEVEICGLKQWTEPDEEGNPFRYVVILYKTCHFTGELKSSREGEVFWIHRSELENYTLAEGFGYSLPLFESERFTENFHFEENGEWKAINK